MPSKYVTRQMFDVMKTGGGEGRGREGTGWEGTGGEWSGVEGRGT